MSAALHPLLAWLLGIGWQTWLLAGVVVPLAGAIALIAWLWFSSDKPDDAHLDEVAKSAMPYDSMYVQNADVERRRS